MPSYRNGMATTLYPAGIATRGKGFAAQERLARIAGPETKRSAQGTAKRVSAVKLAGGPGLIPRMIKLRVPRSLAFGDRGRGIELPVAHPIRQSPAPVARRPFRSG